MSNYKQLRYDLIGAAINFGINKNPRLQMHELGRV